jgi:hypothetical protein
LFKQRKNKTFNYRPRFSKENQELDDFETSRIRSFSDKWNASRGNNQKKRGGMSIRTLIIILVLLLICMYILETKYM